MNDKEIVLSKIADIMSRPGFLKKSNSEFRARLRCIGLNDYYQKYIDFLIPYSYNQGTKHKFENSNAEYDVFLGLDSIFSDLYKDSRNEDIINFLKELTKSFNTWYIYENSYEDFEELARLYEILGLSIAIEAENVNVSACMRSDFSRINEMFSVEDWMKDNHIEVHEAYKSAIDSYTQGHSGACIESCRTCIVSIFSKYKGTENFAKWMRGVYNTSGDSDTASVADLSVALNTELKKEDLADFFNENREGKLTKTKTIYMIYSMMSDYGTHRNESTIEVPTIEDALFCLRLTDSILFWVYSKNK
ncbi:MAG TPA: hypothetical protein GX531_07630 [Methanothermobacter sp.]|nr:hypothetical protein [Methanothermobacter sp.]